MKEEGKKEKKHESPKEEKEETGDSVEDKKEEKSKKSSGFFWVIIILIIIIIVGWIVYPNFNKKAPPETGPKEIKVLDPVKIEEAKIGLNGQIKITVNRVFEEDNISYLKFNFYDTGGVIKSVKTEDVLKSGMQTYSFNYDEIGAERKIDKISIIAGFETKEGMEIFEPEPVKDLYGQRVFDIPDGLISWWNFNDKNVINITEDVVSGNNGTLIGKAEIREGSLYLPGNKNYVVIQNPVDLGLGNEITILAKIKTNYKSNQVLIKRGTYGKKEVSQEYLLYLKNGIATLAFGNSNNDFSGSFDKLESGYISDGNWHFITGVLKNDGTTEIYIDGNLNATGTKTVNGTPNFFLQTIGTLNLDGDENYIGYIDDIMIFNRALSASEIRAIYENEKTTTNSPMTLINGRVVGF